MATVENGKRFHTLSLKKKIINGVLKYRSANRPLNPVDVKGPSFFSSDAVPWSASRLNPPAADDVGIRSRFVHLFRHRTDGKFPTARTA